MYFFFRFSDFKFSTQFVSTLIVAGIILFQVSWPRYRWILSQWCRDSIFNINRCGRPTTAVQFGKKMGEKNSDAFVGLSLFRLQLHILFFLTSSRNSSLHCVIVIQIQRVVRIRGILYTVCILWGSDIPLPYCFSFSAFALDIARPSCI